MMRKVYIIDIDGCIMPSIFPNLGNKDQTPEERRKIIEEVNEKGRNVELFPNFLKFLEGVRSNDILYFVTGRQACNFLQLTLDQLADVDYDQLIFYPNNKKYTNGEYAEWKYQTIKYILGMHKKDHCYIIDDNTDYFRKLERKINPYAQSYTKRRIDSNERWGVFF